MLNFSETYIHKLAIHKVGNKANDEDVQLSENCITIEGEMNDLLTRYYLAPFKTDEFYSFTHETDFHENRVFKSISQLFENESIVMKQSAELARFLHEKSEHPNIKPGEFHVVIFKNCIIEDELADAVGIFKSENKDTYLKIINKGSDFEINSEEGININKLDKGCLIFNTEQEAGFKICIIDKTNKANEAHYWRDDFLGVKLRENDFYHTQTYLNVCKGFIDEVYNEENNIEKADQINMLNKSVNYFKTKEKFDPEEFEEEVMMGESQVVDAFKDYKQQIQQDYDINMSDDFEISKDAVKKANKSFKSVLKLDKNFHVYIHGDRAFIEKGFDEKKRMNYYRLYFDKEN